MTPISSVDLKTNLGISDSNLIPNSSNQMGIDTSSSLSSSSSNATSLPKGKRSFEEIDSDSPKNSRQGPISEECPFFEEMVPKDYNGPGEFININNRLCKGQFINGKFVEGTIYYNGCSFYQGQVQNDKRHGKGELVDSNGCKFIGEFENNHLIEGDIIFTDGIVYRGKYHKGEAHGTGTVIFPSGISYKGQFQNCTPLGPITFDDGTTYLGQTKNFKPHGQGTLTFLNGNRYQGEFEEGHFHGQGRFAFANGRVDQGEFQKGRLYNGTSTRIIQNGNRQ